MAFSCGRKTPTFAPLHRDVAQLVEYASGGRVVAGSGPVIPTKATKLVAFFCLQQPCPTMDFAFEKDWLAPVRLMTERFGDEPDVPSLVFAVGLQEGGQGAKRYKKEEKVEL